MQVFLYAGIVLGILSVGAIADDEQGKADGQSFTGTASEVGPSPYANKGGIGRVLLDDGKKQRIKFHIMKDTKITKMVDGKAQPAKFEEIKKGDTCKGVYDGRLMESNPPQAWAIRFEIIKAAE